MLFVELCRLKIKDKYLFVAVVPFVCAENSSHED